MLELCNRRFLFVTLDGGFLCHHETTLTTNGSEQYEFRSVKAKIMNIGYYLSNIRRLYRQFKGHINRCEMGNIVPALEYERQFLYDNVTELRSQETTTV